MPKIPTNEDFDKKIKEIHGDKFKRIENRIPNQKHIKMYCCMCNKEWEPRIQHLIRGHGCPNCRKWDSKKFDEKVNEIFKKNYYRIGDFNDTLGSNQKVDMMCSICGNIHNQRVYHILEGHGCWTCMRKKLIDDQRMPVKEFIERSKNINGENKYDYSKITYIENQHDKVGIICKDHGIFYQSVGDHIYNKSGCPKCKESKGEKAIRIFLESKNIEYEKNKTFKGCKYKKSLYYDFFLPKYNLCIEFDGRQHETGMIKFNNKKIPEKTRLKTLELFKIRDKIKDEYCILNNIRLLRINYREYKNIDIILENYLFGK